MSTPKHTHDRAWLVYDPDEEGAICIVAPSQEAAWAKAAPDLGYEPDDDDAWESHIIRAVTAKETEEAWDERATLREAIYSVLRVLRPNPNIRPAEPRNHAANLTEALDECARLVDWGWGTPRAVVESGAGMDDPAAEIARLRADLAEAQAALLNERGEGEPPVEGWWWNGDICWEHRSIVRRVECYAVGEWRAQDNDGDRWITKSTHPTARAAMRAASEALTPKDR